MGGYLSCPNVRVAHRVWLRISKRISDLLLLLLLLPHCKHVLYFGYMNYHASTNKPGRVNGKARFLKSVFRVQDVLCRVAGTRALEGGGSCQPVGAISAASYDITSVSGAARSRRDSAVCRPPSDFLLVCENRDAPEVRHLLPTPV